MKKQILLSASFSLFLCCSGSAQQARFDLMRQPVSPAPDAKSNAGLLRAASAPQPDTTLLLPAGMQQGTVNGRAMNNNQYMNSQSNQYQLGTAKGTTTIYYDESGKVKGSNTSIEIR